MAVAGPARLSKHVRKARRSAAARLGSVDGASYAPVAASDSFRRRNRPDLRGKNLPVLLHYDRLWSDLRLSRADLFRHHAEATGKRDQRPSGGLWIDAARKFRRADGSDRRSLFATWNFL